jgi:hypothetical protein
VKVKLKQKEEVGGKQGGRGKGKIKQSWVRTSSDPRLGNSPDESDSHQGKSVQYQDHVYPSVNGNPSIHPTEQIM